MRLTLPGFSPSVCICIRKSDTYVFSLGPDYVRLTYGTLENFVCLVSYYTLTPSSIRRSSFINTKGFSPLLNSAVICHPYSFCHTHRRGVFRIDKRDHFSVLTCIEAIVKTASCCFCRIAVPPVPPGKHVSDFHIYISLPIF